MRRFYVKEGFLLKSHKPNPRSMVIGEYYATEDDEQAQELLKFASQGSCEEKVSKPKEEKPKEPEAPADPAQDLTTVPGVGKKLLGKLTEAGITTVDQLKALIQDEAKAKELLGPSYEKLLKHFQP